MKTSILSGPVAAPAVRPFHDPFSTFLDARPSGGLFRGPRAFFDPPERNAPPAAPPVPAYQPTTTKAPGEMSAEESRLELHHGLSHLLKTQSSDRSEQGEFRKKTDEVLKELQEAAKTAQGVTDDLGKKLIALQRGLLLGGEGGGADAEAQRGDTAHRIAKRFPEACKAVAKAFAGQGQGRGFGVVELTPEGGMILKAEAESNASGQAVLNPEITLDIYDLLLSYGAFRELDVRRMGTKQQKLIVKNGRPTAFWVPENGEIPESGINLGSLFLTAGKIGVIDGFSREMIDDSPVDLGAMILADFAEAVAYRMDYSCFLGDGTNDVGGINGGIVGIVNAATVVTAGAGGTTIGAMKYADVLAVQTGAAQAIYGRMPKWFMNPLMLGAFLGIMDLNGRPIFQNALDAPAYGSIGSINGFPVVLTNVLPADNSASKPVAIFGDAKAYAVGLRQDFNFAFSDEVRFTSNQRVYRGLMRGTGGLKNALALRVLKTAAA